MTQERERRWHGTLGRTWVYFDGTMKLILSNGVELPSEQTPATLARVPEVTETFQHLPPAERPPTAAEPTAELIAYRAYVAEIDAAFLETNRQAIQIGYQRATDRLRLAIGIQEQGDGR